MGGHQAWGSRLPQQRRPAMQHFFVTLFWKPRWQRAGTTCVRVKGRLGAALSEASLPLLDKVQAEVHRRYCCLTVPVLAIDCRAVQSSCPPNPLPVLSPAPCALPRITCLQPSSAERDELAEAMNVSLQQAEAQQKQQKPLHERPDNEILEVRGWLCSHAAAHTAVHAHAHVSQPVLEAITQQRPQEGQQAECRGRLQAVECC